VPKLILVNPSMSTVGLSFMTPRWLFVLAQATPTNLIGDPILVNESIERFDPKMVEAGDIVGVGIASGNCVAGYRVLREAKSRGASVIVGGIHTTIFPDEPLEMGADAVVTGNGDLIWRQVVQDALNKKLRNRYIGGRVPGDALLKARWDLLDPQKYMFPTVQTVAGCPENCSFCSVWVTEGRHPRQRLADKVIEEVNELYELGYRFFLFADDNFNPATLGRIAREPSAEKRSELERIREERLRFFDEYDRSVPKDIYAFTQITSEIVSDQEYLAAMYHKMRVRQALIGVESFSQEGLVSANKQWNPVGQDMIRVIQHVQANGIVVLSSIICGLESDTVQTLETMRRFAIESGTVMAQFTLYGPYPGTKDYYEMMCDKKNRDKPNYVPKRKTEILRERFWLTTAGPLDIIRHANLKPEELLGQNRLCWTSFYSCKQILRRIRTSMPKSWPLMGKVSYFLISLAFKRVYAGYGVSADSVQRHKLGFFTKIFIKIGVSFYSFFCGRKVSIRISGSLRRPIGHKQADERVSE